MSMTSRLARVFGRGTPTEQKSATLSDPAALTLFGIAPSKSGIHVSAATAMRVPAVACAVGLISETVGTLPTKLYDRTDKSALTNHPVYRLVHDQANPWTSAEELREELTTDSLLRGHGYALVIRNASGDPLELHRLDPDTVTLEQHPDGEPVYRHRQGQGGDRLHSYQDILHIQAFGGVSPITLGREAIGLALAAEQHMAGFYLNAGRPSGVIKSPKSVDTDAAKKITASWFNSHSADKAGATALLDEGMDYMPISGSNVDAEFMANRIEQIREIARVFRVPPTLLFELSRGTWSNTEEMGRQFLQMTLKPWLVRWENAYARCLLSPEERESLYVEFVVDDLLSVDFSTRATAYSQYRSMAVLTANEVRAGLNLPPIKGGDELGNPFTATNTPMPVKDPANKETAE